MKISKEGIKFITGTGIATIIFVSMFILINDSIIGIAALSIFILFLLMLFFFRDPDRIPPDVENAVLAPADGRVVNIGEEYENEYMKENGIIVSIFLTIFDVHVNRLPVSGIVEYLKYQKGKFHPALYKKSSTENENWAVGINTGKQKIFFKQIAGILARRIINNLKVGEKVEIGDRFGIIKFGSRVDIILPASTKINVKPKQKVVSGKTIIGVLENEKN